jgi:hypothetical protein
VTHYELLGVSPDSGTEEIRRAYLRRARVHHPDLVATPEARAAAERTMQEINGAWRVLSDPARRSAYDRSLGPVVHGAPRREWQPLDPEDVEGPDPWELLDDTPLDGGRGVPRLLQVAPPLLVVAGAVAVLVGLVTVIPGVLVLGTLAVALGVLLFLAMPVAVVFGNRRADGRDR